MKVTERRIKMLTREDGRCPFAEWFDGLEDIKTSAVIDARLARVESGSLGVHENVGGGTQKKQQGDIAQAQSLWEQYRHDPERLQRDLRAPDA